MQETNTFSPWLTTLDDFRAHILLEGEDAIRAKLAGTRQEMGGFLTSADELGFEIVPVLAANAWSAGPVTRAAFDHILSRLLAGIGAALPADGILLALHLSLIHI